MHSPMNEDGNLCYRQGRYTLLLPGGQLPSRCVKCNNETDLHRRQYKLSYRPPLVYVVILLCMIGIVAACGAGYIPAGVFGGGVVLLVVKMAFQRKKLLIADTCSEHSPNPERGCAIMLVGLLIGAGAFFWLIEAPVVGGGSFIIGVALITLCLLIAAYITDKTTKPIRAKRIDRDGTVLVAGCQEPLLASLPDAPPI